MIFGKEFDSSLWQILKTDKKNRKAIVEFIKELPEELLEKIQEDVIEYRKQGSYKFDKCFEVEVTKDNKQHKYEVDFFDGLQITKYIKNDEYYVEDFQLSLVDFYFPEKTCFEEEWLGHVSRKDPFDKELDCIYTEYNIVRTPFGRIITYFIAEYDRIDYTKYIGFPKPPKDLKIKSLKRYLK